MWAAMEVLRGTRKSMADIEIGEPNLAPGLKGKTLPGDPRRPARGQREARALSSYSAPIWPRPARSAPYVTNLMLARARRGAATIALEAAVVVRATRTPIPA
jgi:hypothetical protein